MKEEKDNKQPTTSNIEKVRLSNTNTTNKDGISSADGACKTCKNKIYIYSGLK